MLLWLCQVCVNAVCEFCISEFRGWAWCSCVFQGEHVPPLFMCVYVREKKRERGLVYESWMLVLCVSLCLGMYICFCFGLITQCRVALASLAGQL